MSSSANNSFEDIEKAIMDARDLTDLVNEDNVTMKNSRGESLLFIAIRKGNIDTIEYLLFDCHAETTDVRNGESALFVLCNDFSRRANSLDIITLLLEYESAYGSGVHDYINAQVSGGLFPLFVASKNGASRIVEFLLDECADPNFVTDEGSNALSVAVLMGHNDVVNLLKPVTAEPKPEVSTPVAPIVASAIEIVDVSGDDIPKTAYDFVYGDEVNIAEFLAESLRNKIIKVHNSYFALCGDDIQKHYLSGNDVNNYIFYPCKRALPPPALGVSKNDVDLDRPLFSASYLAGGLADYVLYDDVNLMLNSNDRYFEILTSNAFEVIPASASAQMFTAAANAVGAKHCQEGIPAKIFRMKILNVVNKKSNVSKEVISLLSDSEDDDAKPNGRSRNALRKSNMKSRRRVHNRKSANRKKKSSRRRKASNRKSSGTKRKHAGR